MPPVHPSSLDDVRGAVAARCVGSLGVALRPPLHLRGPPPLGEPQPLLRGQARLGRRRGRRGRGQPVDPHVAHRGGGGGGSTAHLAITSVFNFSSLLTFKTSFSSVSAWRLLLFSKLVQ